MIRKPLLALVSRLLLSLCAHIRLPFNCRGFHMYCQNEYKTKKSRDHLLSRFPEVCPTRDKEGKSANPNMNSFPHEILHKTLKKSSKGLKIPIERLRKFGV